MRIAIVGSGRTGLAAAHVLSVDPRHVTTVFETRARFGGRADESQVADSVDRLCRLGVTLRRSAQVERLAVDHTSAQLWINGFAEQFDVALVATSSTDERALLARSGIRRHVLRERVYLAEHGGADTTASARSALVRMAADHPTVRLPTAPGAPPSVVRVLRSLARRAAGPVEYLDLSGESWPLAAPAVYIANQRWVLDAAEPLMVQRLRTSTNVSDLEAGMSLASVAADTSSARAVAFAALTVNVPIVPIAAPARPAPATRTIFGRPRACVVIGEPFYPQTSSIEELLDDMRAVLRHLERVGAQGLSKVSRSPS